MASLVRRIAGNPSIIRTHLFPKPKPYPVSYLGPPEPEHNASQLLQLPQSDSRSLDKAEMALPIFPSLPFGFCFDPIGPIGSDQADETMWADSVKKKRKRKMNKHKLRKLRKSLQRKT